MAAPVPEAEPGVGGEPRHLWRRVSQRRAARERGRVHDKQRAPRARLRQVLEDELAAAVGRAEVVGRLSTAALLLAVEERIAALQGTAGAQARAPRRPGMVAGRLQCLAGGSQPRQQHAASAVGCAGGGQQAGLRICGDRWLWRPLLQGGVGGGRRQAGAAAVNEQAPVRHCPGAGPSRLPGAQAVYLSMHHTSASKRRPATAEGACTAVGARLAALPPVCRPVSRKRTPARVALNAARWPARKRGGGGQAAHLRSEQPCSCIAPCGALAQ